MPMGPPPPTRVPLPTPSPLPPASGHNITHEGAATTQKVPITPEDKLTQLHTSLHTSTALPPELPVKETIGTCLGLMRPQSEFAGKHPAIPLLLAYAMDGCPVDCGPDWTHDQVKMLLSRGPHRSACSPKALAQLREETTKKCEQGYARVVRWRDIKANPPPKLKISPVAMIPHKSKPFRCILDLSFSLRHKDKTFTSVNATTTPQALPQSMTQLGLTIHRLINKMAEYYSASHPFMFSKLDIKDGFWRLAVNDVDAWNFCYVLPASTPSDDLDDTEIVVPNCLQMGWCESPPLFCSASETARDIISSLLAKELPPHKFEEIMLRTCAHHTFRPPQRPFTIIEVYVDDFIAASNRLSLLDLRHTSRAMLHGIHAIFPPPSVTKHCGGDPVSEKKLEKGDGTWSFQKEILGWLFDGEAYTIQLPPEKCSEICRLISRMLRLPQVHIRKFQSITGKLQHASFGIPGGKSLFTPFDMALNAATEMVVLTPVLKQALADWRVFVQYLARHPTSIFQLIQQPPALISYTDACKLGAGGVWCSGTHAITPFLWQVEWPEDIQLALVSSDNPTGTITINDLELAGMLLGFLALENRGVDLTNQHVASFCDNSSAVSWSYKLRNSRSVIAGHLLRYMGLRLHRAKASSIIPVHIAGEDNVMADVISRAFKTGTFFSAATNLPSYFNTHFPLEQSASWTECPLTKSQVSCVTRCLRGERLPMASLLKLPERDRSTGAIGARMPPLPALIPTSPQQPLLPWSAISSQAHLLRGSGRADTGEAARSRLEASQMPWRQSPRPSSWLDNPASSTARKTSTSFTSNA